jgi:hypothetical protein
LAFFPSFFLGYVQTKCWPINLLTFMFCSNIPTKFVPKFIVGDLFIWRIKFEVKLFSSCLHLHIDVRIIGLVTILFLWASHSRDLFKGSMAFITKLLGVSSFSKKSHYICPIC